MARPLRIEFPGAVYHVTSRGNARQDIFITDADRHIFFRVLSSAVNRFNIIIHAYCLMGNHYHLLIETPEGNLSETMRHINGVYTQRFNREHKMAGHVFQGRFKAINVEKERYLLALCRYIVLNPVKAKIVEQPQDYLWSSYLETAGFIKPKDFLTGEWILSQFSSYKKTACRKYMEFVANNDSELSIINKTILGGDNFIRQLKDKLLGKEKVSEIPRKERFVARPDLEQLFNGVNPKDKVERNKLIHKASIRHGYSHKEIADFLGIHYTTISKAISGIETNKLK